MSVRVMARLIGLLYVMIFIAAPSGPTGATPSRMLVTLVCDVGVALLMYQLFRPVSHGVSLIAAGFRLAFVVVMSIVALNYFGATHLLQPARSAEAFNAGYGWALVPFGAHCALVGWLIWNSEFLPRALGVLMALAGAAYLMFLVPHLASRLFFPWLAILGVAGEGSLTLWLLFMAVKQDRWKPARDGLVR